MLRVIALEVFHVVVVVAVGRGHRVEVAGAEVMERAAAQRQCGRRR